MGIIQGLAGLQKAAEPRESSGSGEKAVWLKVKDGEQVQIYFLQELDSSSPRYSEKNGLGLAAVEHALPANFMVKALCSMSDEDACYGCEQYRKDYADESVPKDKKGRWRGKQRLYINVLVKPKNGDEPYVAIMSQGFGDKGAATAIINAAVENGIITDRAWTLTRKGEGRDTAWSITPSFKEDASFKPEDYEVYDLRKVATRDVPYAEQAEFFAEASSDSVEDRPKSNSAIEWN